MQHSPLFLALALKAKASIDEIPVQQAYAAINSPENIFIDVRETQEFETGHLPRAISLSKGIIERDIEKKIPDIYTPLILYCSGGFRSALAAESLKKMGYQKIFSIKGGVKAWQEAGYPLVKK